MKLVTVRQEDGTTTAGRVDGDEIVLLPFTDVGGLLRSGDSWREAAGADGPTVGFDSARFAAPVLEPGKVVCVGLNYLRHVLEGGGEVPTYPTLFAKFPDALTGPLDEIEVPAASDCVDWEAELVAVIGRTVRDADDTAAAEAIAGFTVGNDVSMRDWQMRTAQWLQGKTWERATPTGPVLVTTDEVGGATPDLAIRCVVGEVVMQDSCTSDLLFDPVQLVQYVSTIVTLRPGDMIFTGTPDGVGMVRQPAVYLRPGDVLTTEIEGIGKLVNGVVASGGGAR